MSFLKNLLRIKTTDCKALMEEGAVIVDVRSSEI